MDWIIANRFLSLDEMKNNATMLYGYFKSKGWSLNAICGMLGNMQTESTINPGIWENLDEGNLLGGFGLVQWTPATKYIDWAGASYLQGNKQCDRIIYEKENGLQWITKPNYPMSFEEFSTSTDTPYNLALIFLNNYERPLEEVQPIRGEQANFWYEYLTGVTPPDPDPQPTTKRKMPLYMYLKRRY